MGRKTILISSVDGHKKRSHEAHHLAASFQVAGEVPLAARCVYIAEWHRPRRSSVGRHGFVFPSSPNSF